MNMNMDSCLKNLEGNHKDATIIGMMKTSDEEFEKELVEVKARLNVIMEYDEKGQMG